MGEALLSDMAAAFAIGAIPPGALMAAAVLSFLAIGTITFLIVRLTGRHTSSIGADGERLRAIALNSMAQGIVMFDAAERAVVWNERYLELSGLSAEFMQAGRTLCEILRARQGIHTFQLDIETYRRDLLADIGFGKTKSVILDGPDGRSCHVVIAPMAAGGWITTHEDITQQVAAKRIIEEQKRHLDAAISNMPQGLCMFDKEQRLIVCNRQYAELYSLSGDLSKPGTPLRSILRHWARAICAPDELEAYVEDRLSNVGKGDDYQIVNRFPDGRYIAVVHQSMPGGGWVSTHEDVTDAKRREESFRLLFESSPMPMWVMDRRSLRFLAVNDAVVARYGYSREQFMAMTIPDLRAPEERAAFAEYLRALPDIQLDARIGKHRRADGSEIDVEVYSRVLSYNGHAARITVMHDITETKHAADELGRTKKFLDAVIEHVPVPIVVRDVAGLEGDTRGARFYLFNRAYEALTGDSRADLIGKTAAEIYPLDRAALVVNADNDAIQSDSVIDVVEHTIQTAAGW